MVTLAKEDVSAAAIGPAFSLQYASSLPTEAELENAAADPLGDPLTERRQDPLFARKLQRDAVALGQAAQVLAVNGGSAAFASLGAGPMNQALKAVGESAFQSDIAVDRLASGAASIIDGAMTSLGSVPFVGMAAGVIFAAVEFVYRFAGAGYREKRPPLYQMGPTKDENETVRALEMLKDGDAWTRLFLPKTVAVLELEGGGALPPGYGTDGPHPTIGGWEERAADGGWEFQRPLAEPTGRRFGCAPGSLTYVDDGVQARIAASDCTVPSKREPRYIDALRAGKNLEVMLDLVFPRGDWLPSLSALARAVWAVAGQSSSTAMFNINAAKVADEWQAFEDSMVEWRGFLQRVHGSDYDARLPQLSKEARRRHIALFLARVGAAHHDRIAVTDRATLEVSITGRKPSSGQTVGKKSVEHARRLEERQRAAVKTTLNALVSKDAPAFRSSKALRDSLLTERQALLAAGKFDAVEIGEVPDPGLRERILERRPARGNGFADPTYLERARRKRQLEAWLIRKSIPAPVGFDDPLPGGDSGGAGLWLGLAAIAAGLGYVALK